MSPMIGMLPGEPPLTGLPGEMHPVPPVSQGMRLGARLGLILASAYVLLGVVVEAGRQAWLLRSLQVGMLPVLRAAGFLPFGLLFMLAFSAVVGALTGGLVGELWARTGQRVGRRTFALLAMLLCAGIVIGFHLLYRIQIDFFIPAVQPEASPWLSDSLGLLLSYPFLLGVPSILYVVAGAWGSSMFWELRQRGERGRQGSRAGLSQSG